MTTALLSHRYDPSLNHAAPLSRQNHQPRRSEAEPRWIVDRGFWAGQWSYAIKDRLTGAPIIQLCQMQAFRASSRCTILAHRPAGTRPPWRSRPSWFFSVQMMASTRWRSQFGKYRGCFSSLRAGRTRARSGPAKNASVSSPDSPLSVTTAVPGVGRLAGWSVSICRACSRSPYSLGLARPNPVTVPSQVQISSSLAPQYQREWLGQYPYPAQPYRSERFAVTADCPHGTGVASISRSSSALPGVASASQRNAASISGASALRRSLYSDWRSSLGNRCPTCLAAARSQCRSSSKRSSTWATARHTSSASVTSGGLPGPRRLNPREGMMRSVSSTYSAVRRVSRSAITVGSRVRTCVRTPILDTLHLTVTDRSRRVAARPSRRLLDGPDTRKPAVTPVGSPCPRRPPRRSWLRSLRASPWAIWCAWRSRVPRASR